VPVTSPLQAAHDQAAAAAEPIVCTVATPRRPVAPSVYTGAELLTRCNRPGAYDALALPSLQNGRQRLPGDQAEGKPYVPREIAPQPLQVSPRNNVDDPRTMTREFPTVHHPRGEYRPHAGSTPAKVLDYLRAMGGFISHAEICERFDIKRSAITAAFKPILKHGVLVRQIVDGYTGFSLPGWEAPARVDTGKPTHPLQTREYVLVGGLATKQMVANAAASSRQANDPTAESALYELMLRETERSLLARYIAVLQLRQQLFDSIRLFPLPPLTEPPRLTDAA
jgi:hypothetical protein